MNQALVIRTDEDYIVNIYNQLILVDTSDGNREILLPDLQYLRIGGSEPIFYIKKITDDANIVSVNCVNGNFIVEDGSLSVLDDVKGWKYSGDGYYRIISDSSQDSGFITSVLDTSDINLTVNPSGALSADFVSHNISQFTNDSYYTPTIYTKKNITTVVNTVVETNLYNSTPTLPANFFRSGQNITIKLRGYHSAVANPTVRIRIYLNSTVILDTGNVNSANSTNEYVEVDAGIRWVSSGVLGSVIGQGSYVEGGAGANNFSMVNTSAITIDTTIPQTLQLTVQWGTASLSNSFTATTGYVLAPYYP